MCGLIKLVRAFMSLDPLGCPLFEEDYVCPINNDLTMLGTSDFFHSHQDYDHHHDHHHNDPHDQKHPTRPTSLQALSFIEFFIAIFDISLGFVSFLDDLVYFFTLLHHLHVN